MADAALADPNESNSVRKLLQNHSVSDATYARALSRFGEQGVIELVSVVGYYTFQSMVLNTARTPVPPNTPLLKPFPK